MFQQFREQSLLIARRRGLCFCKEFETGSTQWKAERGCPRRTWFARPWLGGERVLGGWHGYESAKVRVG
jgi:hypothetical protein